MNYMEIYCLAPPQDYDEVTVNDNNEQYVTEYVTSYIHNRNEPQHDVGKCMTITEFATSILEEHAPTALRI